MQTAPYSRRPHSFSQRRPLACLAAVGDCNDPITWSGIPYHFLQAARDARLLDEGLRLKAVGNKLRARRLVWNLSRFASGDHYGGYQYSRTFLEYLWQPVLAHIEGSVVVNCFQLFPPSVVENSTVKKWFFIDQTLLQLFDYYKQRDNIGQRIALEALRREREGYQAATGIIVHSRWAARSLIKDYELPAERIHVVAPGANLDPTVYARWEKEEEERRARATDNMRQPLRLIFVGKDWRRKGLDRLLEALAFARKSGARAKLKVIGCQPESLPAHLRATEGVEWAGFIKKRAEADRFLRLVAECEVGCLLSRAEAGGIAFREYHALGLAVLGTDTGGAPEHALPQASVMISPDAQVEEIAATLLELERDEARLATLRDAAWTLRHTVSWAETVRQIASFWPYQMANDSPDGNCQRDLLLVE